MLMWSMLKQFLMQASKLNPKAALPLLGLAQINLLQKETTNAITLLETALQHTPGWNDALMVQPSAPRLSLGVQRTPLAETRIQH